MAEEATIEVTACTTAMTTPSGGYECKFLSAPKDRCICKICYLPSRNPHLSLCCGNTFCKSCLEAATQSQDATTGDTAAVTFPACPCSGKELSTVINKQVGREIKNLHVRCTYQERGCEWQGELNDINNHLGNSDGCQFEDVKCSNQCGKMLQRQYLTSHVETECPHRKVDCQYCHITGEHQFIEGEHKKQCPKLPLPCPNKCEVGSVPCEDTEVHRKECPLEMVQCEYHNVGCCEDWMPRKDLNKHNEEKTKEHLTMTKSQLDSALRQLNNLMVLISVETGSGHPGHIFSGSSGSDPVYNLSGSDPDWIT